MMFDVMVVFDVDVIDILDNEFEKLSDFDFSNIEIG